MRPTLLLLPLLVAAATPLAAAEPVPVPSFRGIELRGGGAVIVRPGASQRVTLISGSSQFTRARVDREGKLVIDTCNARCPHRYKMVIEVQSPSVLPMGISGGGKITVSPGFRPQKKIAAGVQGGGLIDLRSVQAETVAAGIHGGGQILVGPSKTLAAGVNGGGEVRYAGNPRVASAVNGGGIVRRGN